MKNKFAIAVKCVAVYKNKVLLLTKTEEEIKEDACKNVLDLPGGRVEYKEELDLAMSRELYEETSLYATEIVLKSANTVIRPDGLHLVILLYKCICESDEVKLSEEHVSYQWIEVKKISSNKNVPDWIKGSVAKVFDDKLVE